MTEPLRVGLVGYGLAGRVFHAPFIEASGDLALHAIVTASSDRARAASAAYPTARVVHSLAGLDGGHLDLVVLGGPPHTHQWQARWALARDIAVIIDKPFVPSVAAALDLLTLSERRGGRLTVFHNRRWDGDFRALRRFAGDGMLGELFELESSFEHWDPRPASDWKHTLPISRGGGVTMDLGSHLVDQAILLLGPVSTVEADLRGVRRGAGNDDVAHVRLTHLSGARSTLRMSRLGNQPAARFRLSGTAGSAVIHGLDEQEALLDAGTPVAELRAAQQANARTANVRIDAIDHEVDLPPGDYAAFYEGVVSWLRHDAPAPVDPWEALEVLRVLERATAALR